MTRRYRGRSGAGLFSGLLFLGLGVLLLMGNMELLAVRPLLTHWWPALLVIIGIKHLLLMRGPNAWVGAAFWIGTGLLFLLSTHGYLAVSVPNLLWPVMLIWFGAFTVLGVGGGCNWRVGNGSQS